MKTSTEVARGILDLFEERDGKEPSPEITTDVFLAVDGSMQEAFRIGFEHAVAGGEEGGRLFFPRHSLPLVMYFGSEADRQGMIDAVTEAKPMVKLKIPERKR